MSSSSASGGGGEKVIELSIEETNALRLKLGLKPLNVSSSTSSSSKRRPDDSSGREQESDVDDEPTTTGRSAREAHHVPAENLGDLRKTRERIEEARLAREVREGVARIGGEASASAADEAGEGESALDWASRMRSPSSTTSKSTNKKSKKKKSTAGTATAAYTSEDLSDLRVSHSVSELTTGQDTILTLADESILRKDEHGTRITGLSTQESTRLENVDVTDRKKAKDRLREKRRVEMGSGHAGGYAGYDDDEFDELGGFGVGPGGLAAASGGGGGPDSSIAAGAGGKIEGFRLGDAAAAAASKEGDEGGGLFPSRDRAVSVQSAYATSGTTKFASDFLTAAEDIAEDDGAGDEAASERKRRKMEKKRRKLFKKMKKRDKREKKRARRRRGGGGGSDDDEDEKGSGGDESPDGGGAGGGAEKGRSSLVDDLEASATAKPEKVDRHRGGRGRKRPREDDEDGGGGGVGGDESIGNGGGDEAVEGGGGGGEKAKSTPEDGKMETVEEEDESERRRREFDRVMEKGNERTRRAFSHASKTTSGVGGGEEDAAGEEEDDDSFLNAALAKARRLKRLRELAGAGGGTTKAPDGGGGGAVATEKDDAVVARAVREAPTLEGGVGGAAAVAVAAEESASASSAGGITFESDATREFSRAMRDGGGARKKATTEASRKDVGKKVGKGVEFTSSGSKSKTAAATEGDEKDGEVESEKDGDADMAELAEQMSEDDDEGGNDDSAAFGSNATMAKPIGRGLSSVLSLLKSTGEISGKNAMEEQRGRAKDERTYEDYEPLDLRNVVKIDPRTATEKDVEMSRREVKLDYRDEHGRLLTRKEAWRQMNYQFHGYGSSVKNEERRLRQIAREREEGARQNEAGSRGTLGALRATQRATGKAFVVHRT